MKRIDLLNARVAAEKIGGLLGESSKVPTLQAAIFAGAALRALLCMYDTLVEQGIQESDEEAGRQRVLFEELQGPAVSAQTVRNAVLAAMKFDGEEEAASAFDMGRRAFGDGLSANENPHRADTPEAAQWVCGFEFARPRFRGAKQAQIPLPVVPAAGGGSFTAPDAEPGADISIEILAPAISQALQDVGSDLVVSTEELEALSPDQRLELYEWTEVRSDDLRAVLTAIEWAQTIEAAIKANPGFEQVSTATSSTVLRTFVLADLPEIGASFAEGSVSDEVIGNLLDTLYEESPPVAAEADQEPEDEDPEPLD